MSEEGDLFIPQNHDTLEDVNASAPKVPSTAVPSSSAPVFHPSPVPKSHHHYSALRPREIKNFSANQFHLKSSSSSSVSQRPSRKTLADGLPSSDKPAASTDETRDSDKASTPPASTVMNLACQDDSA